MDIVESHHKIKHSGAGWMLATKRLSFETCPPSQLGIKVMNVLGQVWQGIYHIDNYVLKPKIRWDGKLAVAVTISGCLSTYDFAHLTLLVLCCQKADIVVCVDGSFKGYTQLIFCPSPGDSRIKLPPSPLSINDESTLEERLGQCTHIKRQLNDIHRGHIWSTEGLHWYRLLSMVDIAHRTATRFQIEGRSPDTLSVMVTQRDREGAISQRHPKWDDHKRMLQPLWDIDYNSIS
jgi:hypothetical protein